MGDKMMRCGPIHRLPKNLWLSGLIALDNETGFYTFHWANIIPDLQQYKQRLIKEAGVKEEEIIFFEGDKKETDRYSQAAKRCDQGKKENAGYTISSPS